MDILVIRNYSQHRNAAKGFHLSDSGLEQTQVPPKFVDNYSLDALPVFRGLKDNGTVCTGKYAATVNVGHQEYIGTGMAGHRKIDQVLIAKIDLGNAAGSFKHNRIVTGCQPVVSGTDFSTKGFEAFTPEIIPGISVADGLSVQNNL